MPIGYGLFANVTIPPNTIITKFIGEVISMSEYESRVTLGKGGYAVFLKHNKVLNCFDYCARSECWASSANSPTNLDHSSTYMFQNGRDSWCTLPNQSPTTSNARVFIQGMTAYLKSDSKEIPCGHEIMHSYGSKYRYPK